MDFDSTDFDAIARVMSKTNDVDFIPNENKNQRLDRFSLERMKKKLLENPRPLSDHEKMVLKDLKEIENTGFVNLPPEDNKARYVPVYEARSYSGHSSVFTVLNGKLYRAYDYDET